MNGPLALLQKVEEEVAALLAAGTASPRAERRRLADLAEQVAALRLERLAVELRGLVVAEEPRARANGALSALVMTRKLRERLLPWPVVPQGPSITLGDSPRLIVAAPAEPPASPDSTTLAGWLAQGPDLLRAYAAGALVARGEEAVPPLARLAKAGTVAVRRDAVAALGRIGGEATLGALLSLLGDAACWPQLREALLARGEEAPPALLAEIEQPLALHAALAQIVRETQGKKDGRERRLQAAALLYRLGAYATLTELLTAKEEQAPLLGLWLAARARLRGGWQEPPEKVDGVRWGQSFPALAAVTLARAEGTGDPEPAYLALEDGPVNELEAALRWSAAGGQLAPTLAAHYLARLSGSTAKERQRAGRALRGLAEPALVPALLGLLVNGEGDASALCAVLADCGGSGAAGVLLDVVSGNFPPSSDAGGVAAAIKELGELGDPGTLPPLVDMLAQATSPAADWRLRVNHVGLEMALASFGDSAVDYLAERLRTGDGAADAVKQVLLQMKGPRAKAALKDTDVDGEEALLARLGHPRLGAAAAKALARRGESALAGLDACLGGGNHAANLNALAAVTDIGGPRAYEVIYRAVERRVVAGPAYRSPDNFGERAIKALAAFDDPRSADLFVRALDSPTWLLQNAAVPACVGLGEAVVPRVLPLLQHPSPFCRAGALSVLGQLRVAAAQEGALALLADPDPTVRAAAVEALSEVGSVTRDPRVAETLGKQLVASRTNGDWQFQGVAIAALIKLGRREGVTYLKRFGEGNEYFGRAVAEAIKKIEQAAAERSVADRLRGLLGGRR